jgi:hypothetical protein
VVVFLLPVDWLEYPNKSTINSQFLSFEGKKEKLFISPVGEKRHSPDLHYNTLNRLKLAPAL